jgi:hypothetical protein
MQNTAPLPKILERACPNCDAKLDSDLPYCGCCGFGLPRFPRPKSVIVATTTLFFVVGVPAGLCAAYCLTFAFMGYFSDVLPAIALGCVALLSARLMLAMCEGKRGYTPPTLR